MMMENDIIKKYMKNKTAVDWMIDELYNQGFLTHKPITSDVNGIKVLKILNHAKEMEKEQIINSFGIGCQVESTRLIGYQEMAEQYYKETYGK